jgi:hypothetical protein
LLALLQFFLAPYIISILVLENVLPDAGFHKRATFSTLNVGLVGTGKQTRATCVAKSGTNRSVIHNALCSLGYRHIENSDDMFHLALIYDQSRCSIFPNVLARYSLGVLFEQLIVRLIGLHFVRTMFEQF